MQPDEEINNLVLQNLQLWMLKGLFNILNIVSGENRD
jgi:hypothetical protein